MVDVKINDLPAAGIVTADMQLETDIGGVTPNKITPGGMQTFVLDSVIQAGHVVFQPGGAANNFTFTDWSTMHTAMVATGIDSVLIDTAFTSPAVIPVGTYAAVRHIEGLKALNTVTVSSGVVMDEIRSLTKLTFNFAGGTGPVINISSGFRQVVAHDTLLKSLGSEPIIDISANVIITSVFLTGSSQLVEDGAATNGIVKVTDSGVPPFNTVISTFNDGVVADNTVFAAAGETATIQNADSNSSISETQLGTGTFIFNHYIDRLTEKVTPVVGTDFLEIFSNADKGTRKVLLSYYLTQPGLFKSQQNFGAVSLTDAANISWNLNTQQAARIVPTGTRILDNPTNQVDGGVYTLEVLGPGDLTFGTAYKFEGGVTPIFTGGSASIDKLTFESDGTNMLGTARFNFS